MVIAMLRAPSILPMLGIVLIGCNPYDPNLPNIPFRCGDTEPMCPSGYACNADNECEKSDEGVPDAAPADGSCSDPAEPNNMMAAATETHVWNQIPDIQLEELSLCPSMDADYFHLIQPQNCGGVGPACPNLEVLVEFEDLSVTPTLAILNFSGAPVAMGGTTSTPGQMKAVLANVAQNQYYVRVTSQAVLGHYRLTIDGNGP